MDEIRDLLGLTAEIASDFYETLGERSVAPPASTEELRAAFGGALPESPTPPRQVVAELAAAADRGVVAIPSGRYFGFVIGGAVPAGRAPHWLAPGWGPDARPYA